MSDPIFKGCTRPATWLGAPFVPLVSLTALTALVTIIPLYLSGGFAFIFFAVVWIPIYVTLVVVTRIDDQRFHQWCIRGRLVLTVLTPLSGLRALTVYRSDRS